MDREYFQEIGLLDEGMEVYGGENVELGIRVRNKKSVSFASYPRFGVRKTNVLWENSKPTW